MVIKQQGVLLKKAEGEKGWVGVLGGKYSIARANQSVR